MPGGAFRQALGLAASMFFVAMAPAFGQTTDPALPDLGALPAFPGAGGGVITCAIRPLQIVEIAATKAGVIREVLVKPGEKVTAGSKIAIFDDELDQIALAAAEARAAMTANLKAATERKAGLEKKVARMTKAANRGAVSASDLEEAKLELAMSQGEVDRESEALRLAEIEVKQAAAMLDKSVVTSPVDGIVGEDPIDPGESPNAKPIAVIYVVKPLRVEAYVPTAALASFLNRETFSIVVNGDRSNPVAVTLDHVSQVADLSSNTQSVFFTLDAPGILPGYQCMIEG